MKFTIITATYNSEKTIKRTLNSLLNQTVLNFEYIIIDGKSSDKTVEIIKSYKAKFKDKNISFQWVSEKDKGIYDAWNKGLKLSKGEWISFLGSDDYYVDNAIETYTNLLDKVNSNNYDWLYSNVRFVDADNNSRILNSIWTWKEFRRNIVITPAHVGSFHNKEYFNKYGIFDTTYQIAGDYELLLRAKNNLRTLKVEKITAVMNADGISNNMIKKVFKETFRAKHETGKVNYFICYIDYYISFIKYGFKKALSINKHTIKNETKF